MAHMPLYVELFRPLRYIAIPGFSRLGRPEAK